MKLKYIAQSFACLGYFFNIVAVVVLLLVCFVVWGLLGFLWFFGFFVFFLQLGHTAKSEGDSKHE